MGNACQLTGSLQRRAELPASGRKGNLFLRGKEQRVGREEGRSRGRGGQRWQKALQDTVYALPFDPPNVR